MSAGYRLPDGTATSNVHTMLAAWDALAAPFIAMGYERYGFDPGISFVMPDDRGNMGPVLTMCVRDAMLIGAALTKAAATPD